MIYVHLNNEANSRVFDSVEAADARPEQRIISGLEGSLLRSNSTFSYFMLVALEAGSPVRALLLLLCLPLAWLVTHILHVQHFDIRLYTLVSFAGLHTATVACVCRAVLPKAFLDDVHPKAYRLFMTCKRRSLLTSLPRVMVESLAKEYLGTEQALGSELQVTGTTGWYTGLITSSGGLLSGKQRYSAVHRHFQEGNYPDIGIGSSIQPDAEFLQLCKKGYVVESDKVADRLPKEQLEKPVIFHDGRLVRSPTPLWAITLCLWIPIAIPLAILRMLVGVLLPKRIATPLEHLLGVSVRHRGSIPPPCSSVSTSKHSQGVLFVLSHRTLVDPVFISFLMGQEVAAVTYSLSRLSELISPIKTVRLTRSKEKDASTMDRLLKQGHLAVCPEGTTCREAFLLRFSALFAELTDRIFPVSLRCNAPVFHGTSARGWKCLDALFLFMNPVVSYELNFLGQLDVEKTCRGGGVSSHDVANYVQRMMADSLGFQCTTLTRKDKYRILAGNDGVVVAS